MAAGTSLRDMEKQLIRTTLRDVGGNRTKAAKLLGISIRTLRNKLNEYRESGAAAAARRNASRENPRRSDGTEIAVT
jgi:DNA-binding NtrC family response regulator